MAVTQEKIKKFGKLVKDSAGEYHFYDVNDSGLYFRLSMLMRKSGEDEAGFNARIGENNAVLYALDMASGDEVVYKSTIGLVPTQAKNLSASWRAIFAEKTYFFLYDDTQTGLKIGSSMPGYGELYADFVWLSDDKVWTWMSADRLAYQYPRTSTITGATVATGEDDSGDDTPEGDDTPASISSGETILHIYCPHCGEKIF